MSWKRLNKPDTVDLFGTGETRTVSLTHSSKLSKNQMPGSVRQLPLVALVKKTSLNFGCLKTIDGLGTAGDNMT
jgi:hypothetical protein